MFSSIVTLAIRIYVWFSTDMHVNTFENDRLHSEPHNGKQKLGQRSTRNTFIADTGSPYVATKQHTIFVFSTGCRSVILYFHNSK